MGNKIKKGDIVFYNDKHEAWMTNIIAEVVEVVKDKGDIAVISTRGYNAPVEKKFLTKLPVDKYFPIYVVTRYKPKHAPD